MPLRDHFRPPLDRKYSWDEVHGGWPAMIVTTMNPVLPQDYAAGPHVRLGPFVDFDAPSSGDWQFDPLAPQDEYEVRVYDDKHGRRLVAAVELVSPANKDRPESRRAFAAKCAALLQKQVSVTIVDLVTVPASNLYAELLDLIGQNDPALGEDPPPIYAVACRVIKYGAKPGEGWQFEAWLHPLEIGRPLPIMPLWLTDNFSVPLDVEASYEETCKALRIA